MTLIGIEISSSECCGARQTDTNKRNYLHLKFSRVG